MKIVGDIPADGKRLNIEGEKGESLFHHPVIWCISPDLEQIKNQYERYNEIAKKPMRNV